MGFNNHWISTRRVMCFICPQYIRRSHACLDKPFCHPHIVQSRWCSRIYLCKHNHCSPGAPWSQRHCRICHDRPSAVQSRAERLPIPQLRLLLSSWEPLCVLFDLALCFISKPWEYFIAMFETSRMKRQSLPPCRSLPDWALTVVALYECPLSESHLTPPWFY